MNDDSMIEEFKIEASEMFESAEDGLLNIERGLDFNSNYNSIFRSFHSLKGAAGMFGMNELQSHMHKLESLFEAQKSKGVLSKFQVDYFLHGVDAGRTILEGNKPDFVHIDYEEFSSKILVSTPELKIVKEVIEVFDRKNGVIYVVDDEPDIVDVLSQILESKGFSVVKFYNGEDAFKSIDLIKPDIILSDILMPKFNGIQMLKAIHEINSSIPVIFISGNLSKEKMQEALLYGAYAFLDKPFDNVNIVNICQNAVKKSQAMQLLEKSINYILYQFNDLDEYLKNQGKENVRITLKNELQIILEQRKILKKAS